MVEGILSISVDPPLIGFLECIGSGGRKTRWKNSSVEEIRCLLVELQKIAPDEQWPPRDCLIRQRGDFRPETLVKFGLLELDKPQETQARLHSKG